MAIFKLLGAIFLFPGNFVLARLGVSVEQDEGMFRSMINMLFWGLFAVVAMIPWMFKAAA